MLDDYDKTPKTERLPCGGLAIFDKSSGISYRCDQCFAVVGSVGMPDFCKELLKKEKEERDV